MSDKETVWGLISNGRSPEVWIAIAAGMLYVYQKSDNNSKMARAIDAGISGMIGYSVGADAAEWAGIQPALGVLLVSALGYLTLDAMRSIVADRKALKAIIVNRLGGGSNSNGPN